MEDADDDGLRRGSVPAVGSEHGAAVYACRQGGGVDGEFSGVGRVEVDVAVAVDRVTREGEFRSPGKVMAPKESYLVMNICGIGGQRDIPSGVHHRKGKGGLGAVAGVVGYRQ